MFQRVANDEGGEWPGGCMRRMENNGHRWVGETSEAVGN